MSRGPLGPEDTWKSGQRVVFEGVYIDQFGVTSTHLRYATFPPCIGRKGVGAYRRLLHGLGSHAE